MMAPTHTQLTGFRQIYVMWKEPSSMSDKTAQWVKANAKPGNLSLTSRTHTVDKNWLKLTSDSCKLKLTWQKPNQSGSCCCVVPRSQSCVWPVASFHTVTCSPTALAKKLFTLLYIQVFRGHTLPTQSTSPQVRTLILGQLAPSVPYRIYSLLISTVYLINPPIEDHLMGQMPFLPFYRWEMVWGGHVAVTLLGVKCGVPESNCCVSFCHKIVPILSTWPPALPLHLVKLGNLLAQL